MNSIIKLFSSAFLLVLLFLMLKVSGCEILESDKQIDLSGWVVTDVDGNKYRTVVIGDQLWMAENLRVTHYRDGTPIPFHGTGGSHQTNEFPSHGIYTVYPHGSIGGLNSDSEVLQSIGAYYNLHAVTDERGLCPEGLHVPEDSDWKKWSAIYSCRNHIWMKCSGKEVETGMLRID